jgi:hypothetical protein
MSTTLLSLPDTALVTEASLLVSAALEDSVIRHSHRAFHLGMAYAAKNAITFDAEDLALAALFHDVGLAAGLRPPKVAFTLAGSRALARFLEEHDVPRARIAPLVDAIDFHMQLFPRWSKGPVAGLLQVGAWMDVTGLRRGSIPERAAEIEEALPAGDFREGFNRRLLRTIDGPAACLGLVVPTAFRSAML